jgi:hypothetical protein
MSAATKPEEKCVCLHEGQDWHMNFRNSYPLLKDTKGIAIPEFDDPNLRHGVFDDMMTRPPDGASYRAGRPYAPLGSASLDATKRPKIPDVPRWGAEMDFDRYRMDPTDHRQAVATPRFSVMDAAKDAAPVAIPTLILVAVVGYIVYRYAL